MIVKHPGHRIASLARVFGETELVRSNRVTVLEASNGCFLPRQVGLLHQRDEAAALQVVGKRQTGKFAQGRVDVDELSQSRRLFATVDPRGLDDQRGVHRRLETAVLAPEGMLAQVPAVVAPQDDNRVVAQIQPIKFVQQLANLGVGVAHTGVIAVDERAGLLV